MRLFLDSANLDEIKEAVSWNIIDGVTTNPSLIKKAVMSLRGSDAGLDMESYIKKILAQVGRMCPVSLEVAGTTAAEMIEQGIILHEKFDQVAGNVVIKIPVCTMNTAGAGLPFDGLAAVQGLADEKIPVNATLVFTPEQALLAAKAVLVVVPRAAMAAVDTNLPCSKRKHPRQKRGHFFNRNNRRTGEWAILFSFTIFCAVVQFQ